MLIVTCLSTYSSFVTKLVNTQIQETYQQELFNE